MHAPKDASGTGGCRARLAHGWRLVEAALAGAGSRTALVVHWFATPTDASVHMDDHFGDDARTLRFMAVVVPTLADQLAASRLAVAVPWELEAERALMVLLTAARGEPAAVQARALTAAAEASGPPWWRLAAQPVPAPERFRELAALLRI